MPDEQDEQILSADDRKKIALAFAGALILELKTYWAGLIPEVQPALEAAALSGAKLGATQTAITDSETIAATNEAAREFAAQRSAELVGLQRDADGELVEDETAEWAISDLTRERIEAIVTEEFARDLPLDQIQENILARLAQEKTGSGIFSDARSELIAETEIARAQSAGHFEAWTQSGVQRVRWITMLDERTCGPCAENNGQVRKLGERFESGDRYPGGHPHCRCQLSIAR